MFKILAAVLLSLGIIATPLASSVYAEGEETTESSDTLEIAPQINVSPSTASVALKPGAVVDYSLVVTNDNAESLDITVYAAPYSIQNEDYDVDFEKETSRTQLSRWISFIKADGSTTDKYQATIAGNSKSYINYRVTIPEDLPAGGQYATIFIQTNEASVEPLESSGIQAIPRVGVVIYGRNTGGENNESAEITDVSIPLFLLNGPVYASALVKNTGNTDIEVKYDFTITSIVGTELYHSEGTDPIIPDASRRERQEWANTQPMGIFNVKYRIEVLGEVQETTKLVIILPAYMIVIAFFVLTLLTIWIIILIRKRRERKSRLVV